MVSSDHPRHSFACLFGIECECLFDDYVMWLMTIQWIIEDDNDDATGDNLPRQR